MERLLKRMDRIEENFDQIYVRHNGETVALKDVPSKEAAYWIFRWLREVINDDVQQRRPESDGGVHDQGVY